MRVAAYVRISTSRQVKLETIEQQLEMVSRYAREKGWELAEEDVFRDDGYSGTTLKRPALDALRDKARLRELEIIVVLSPDRLARNYVHQMVLIEELEKAGCKVEFVERPMSSEPNDQLLLQIRGAVAEYERTLLAERMRRGRLAKYKAGLLLPWTHTPYGLRVGPDRPRDPPHRTPPRLGRPASTAGVDLRGTGAGGGQPGALRPRRTEALQKTDPSPGATTRPTSTFCGLW